LTGPARLTCRPTERCAATRSIEVVARADGATLIVEFALAGDLSRVRIPPRREPPRAGEKLWEHTCFEAFVRIEGAEAYHELNFSPSGEWQAHAFRRYRDGGPLDAPTLAPKIEIHRAAERLALEARVDLARLDRAYERARLRLGLCAVIEDVDGELSYWALHHPPGKPDFHHADAFALTLETGA
jgi:hypothetical protein